MSLFPRVVALVLLACAPAALSSASAAEPTAGRWVLRTADRTILLLELSNDRGGRGWSGAVTRPKHFQSDSTFLVFSNVEGPAVREPVLRVVAHPDRLDLTVRDDPSVSMQL